MKKITVVIIFILIQFSPPGVFGSDEDKSLTGGFTKTRYKGEGKNKEWVDLSDYKEMEKFYKDFLKDITNGVPFNEKVMGKIAETLNAGINHQLEKLKGCMGGEYTKKIEAKEKNGEILLRFDDNLGIHDGYHEKETLNTKENITLSGSYLAEIISDITKSLKNNQKWYPENIYTLPYYTDLLTDLGHEMIHSHAGFGGGEREECIAHCLTRKCLNSKHDPRAFQYSVLGSMVTNPLHCDKFKFPPGIKNKMGEGKCFCGVNWENIYDNEPCKDENKPTPPTSDPGSDEERDDQADDHYSFASATNYITNLLPTNIFDFPIEGKRNFISFNFYPAVLIYDRHFVDIQNLLKKYDEDYLSDYIHDYFSNNHKILFIGSGELIGDEKSAIIKQALENFVANGGVLLLETEQYGSQIEDLVPIPENEPLKFIGFT
jgi:hypothetical protein